MSDLKARMFIPVDKSEMCLNLDKMDASVMLLNDEGQPIHYDGNPAHKVILKIKGGFQPTNELIDTLNDVCGPVGGEQVYREIMRQCNIQLLSQAIL